MTRLSRLGERRSGTSRYSTETAILLGYGRGFGSSWCDDIVDYDVAYAVGAVEGGKISAVLRTLVSARLSAAVAPGRCWSKLEAVRRIRTRLMSTFFALASQVRDCMVPGVFHAADGVGAVAVGLVFDPVASPLAEELAVPEGGCGEVVTAEDGGRWVMGSFVGILHATSGNGGGIGESRVLRESKSPVNESGVEVVDVPVVAEAGGAGLFVGGGFAEGNVAGLPVRGNLSGRRSRGRGRRRRCSQTRRRRRGSHVRVDPPDASDEKVGVGEVKAGGRGREPMMVGGGTGGAYSGDDAEDSGLFVEAEVVVTLGKGDDGVEVLALDPSTGARRGRRRCRHRLRTC